MNYKELEEFVNSISQLSDSEIRMLWKAINGEHKIRIMRKKRGKIR